MVQWCYDYAQKNRRPVQSALVPKHQTGRERESGQTREKERAKSCKKRKSARKAKSSKRIKIAVAETSELAVATPPVQRSNVKDFPKVLMKVKEEDVSTKPPIASVVPYGFMVMLKVIETIEAQALLTTLPCVQLIG